MISVDDISFHYRHCLEQFLRVGSGVTGSSESLPSSSLLLFAVFASCIAFESVTARWQMSSSVVSEVLCAEVGSSVWFERGGPR